MTIEFEKMIKLEVEIKDGKFIHYYRVGASMQSSESPLTVDNLKAFTNLLNYCREVSMTKSDKD